MPGPPLTIFADFTSAESYVTEVAAWNCAAVHDLEVDCRGVVAASEDGSGGLNPGGGPEVQIIAKELGLELQPQGVRPATAKAHELARVAKAEGVEEEVRRAIYAAYWADGRDIGRIDVLQAIAADAGLDSFDVKVALDIDRFREDVARDGRIARQLGIRRVPVVYVGRGPGAQVLTGAQSVENLERLVHEAMMKE